MWSNTVRNLVLLVVGIIFAGIIRLSFQGADSILGFLEGNGTLFGTASYDGTVYYVDVEGTEFVLEGTDVITFCEDALAINEN